MKKIRYYLFALLLFLTLNVVKAQVFVEDWSVPFDSDSMTTDDFTKYGNGYLIIERTDEHTQTIRTYDQDGELIKEGEILDSNSTYDIFVDGNNIYLIICNLIVNGNAHRFDHSVIKLNENLEIVASSEKTNNNLTYITTIDGEVYVENRSYNKLYKFNEDLSSYEEITQYNEKDYFPEEYYESYFATTLNNNYADGIKVRIYNDHLLVASTKRISETGICEVQELASPVPDSIIAKATFSSNRCYASTVTLYDNDENELWTKEYEGMVNSVELLEDYALVSTYDEIIVYDYEGNEIQRITAQDVIFENLLRGTNSFMTFRACVLDEGLSLEMRTPSPCQSVYQVYTLGYKINTKTEGKGKVNVAESSLPGVPVTFTIEPEEGYVLSNVKVTDSTGKVIEFKEYTFTMPSADVEVEVLFSKLEKNPDTTTGAIITLVSIIGIAAVAAIIYEKKKFAWLK